MSSEHNSGEDSLTIRILPDGTAKIDFFATSWSDFIVKNIYSQKERDEVRNLEKETGVKFRGIFCG